MIQRKQTLYLLIAAILTGVLLFPSLAHFNGSQTEGLMNILGTCTIGQSGELTTVTSTPFSILLVLLSLIASLVTIGLFKLRVVQTKLCLMNMVMLLGLTGMIFLYGHTSAQLLKAAVAYEWYVVFPPIALILNALAYFAIKKDEALVRSVNRIR